MSEGAADSAGPVVAREEDPVVALLIAEARDAVWLRAKGAARAAADELKAEGFVLPIISTALLSAAASWLRDVLLTEVCPHEREATRALLIERIASMDLTDGPPALTLLVQR